MVPHPRRRINLRAGWRYLCAHLIPRASRAAPPASARHASRAISVKVYRFLARRAFDSKANSRSNRS
jgi:hypothetical protein